VITYRQLLALLAVARAGSLTLGGVFLRNWNILPEASPPSWFGHTRDVPIRPRQACDATLALRRLTCDETTIPQRRDEGVLAPQRRRRRRPADSGPPDPIHLPRLLRPGGERRGEHGS